jgi:hypothetical protein
MGSPSRQAREDDRGLSFRGFAEPVGISGRRMGLPRHFVPRNDIGAVDGIAMLRSQWDRHVAYAPRDDRKKSIDSRLYSKCPRAFVTITESVTEVLNEYIYLTTLICIIIIRPLIPSYTMCVEVVVD